VGIPLVLLDGPGEGGVGSGEVPFPDPLLAQTEGRRRSEEAGLEILRGDHVAVGDFEREAVGDVREARPESGAGEQSGRRPAEHDTRADLDQPGMDEEAVRVAVGLH
jgi:hypothetical protein